MSKGPRKAKPASAKRPAAPKGAAKSTSTGPARPKAGSPRNPPGAISVPAQRDPEFVRQASAAERKAALESIVRADPVPTPVPTWRRQENPIPQPARRSDPVPLPPKPAEGPKTPPRYVILDTNALMMQFQFHIDLESELKRILDFQYEMVVPSTVKDELSAIASEGAGKDAAEARMALELAKTFKELPSGPGDPGILRLAEELGAIVVTNDKILRARLRAKDVPNVHMRSKAFLTIEGHIRGL